MTLDIAKKRHDFAKLKLLSFVCALLACVSYYPDALSQVDTFAFDTTEQQQRFRRLSNELRCPLCQNTNLTGSTGGVAEDLRREIHRMIVDGMTDAEIEQFMFERYGDFIFYRPRLRTETVLLWFGPLLFLLVGGLIAFRISRRASIVNDKHIEFDDKQRAQLKELLNEKP